MEDREGILMIRPNELKRYQLISKVLDRNINQQEAAELLGISDRQVRRIVQRVRVEGERGVIHR
ncbi:MAG: helix-turn-helix domain-containing protein, partial [Candidatus Omnitrophica bacterium]|nr:helix-turn-helix domain-containing protein [Candidatus Omnitrophota bacterium]